jgi:hypothetical protein
MDLIILRPIISILFGQKLFMMDHIFSTISQCPSTLKHVELNQHEHPSKQQTSRYPKY